ncbi:MAG: LPS assembly protein LptD [Phycisphaeraceae bacterium]|nr:LPS assembly protein LptD [Phycisphaeraceae bacterium]
MSQLKNTRSVRTISDAAIMLVVILLALTGFGISGLEAQGALPSIADLPMADPTIDSDAQFHAQSVSNWEQDGVQMMFLKRDVIIAVGTYGFRADSAVIRIQRQVIADGREVRHIWMYLNNAQPLLGRGPTSAAAPRLLVTVSTTGKVDLSTDLLQQVDRSGDPLTGDAQRRFASHLIAISGSREGQVAQESADIRRARQAFEKVTASGGPTIVMDPQREQFMPQSPFSAANPKAAVTHPALPGSMPLSEKGEVLTSSNTTPAVEPVVSGGTLATTFLPDSKHVPRASKTSSILPPVGTISLAFDEMVVDLGKEQPYAVLMGNVGVMYVDRQGQLAMSLRADQAVIFLSKDQQHDQVFSKLNTTAVSGVYLEDNVQVTDGSYTVRAPRAYYDTQRNKAVVLDAVMYTWSVKNQVPLYMRAEKIMQLSQTQWQANEAQLTTSEFAEPHFSIAARTITLTQKTDKQGNAEYHYVAQKVGVKWGNTKLFGGAKMSGIAQQIPLKSINMSYSGNNGPNLRTTWDTFMLLGRDKPEGVESALALDYQGQHGAGLGLDLSYDKAQMFGDHHGYVLLHDGGKDEIGGRNIIKHDGELRGYYQGQHRSFLDEGWELSLELGYVSDETFLEEFYRDQAETQKSYEASLYLKKQEHQTAMTLLTSYDVNDFTVNTSQLQYQGYTVSKLPELGYYSIGESLLDNRLTYYGETRASRMRVQAGNDSPSDRGFTAAQSALLFAGQPSTTSFRDAYSATGAPTGFVLRLDSRHEIQAPMKAGALDVVPYAVGRVTAYDDDFKALNGNDQNIRLWGSVGVRVHTQFNKTISDVDNRLFDIHQLRHIVEPSIDVSFSDTNVNAMDLPVYDYDVERLRDGMTVALGLRNTLQTKRGGPGRWRTVDWLTVDSRYVVSSDDAEKNPSSLAHYFGYRPEYTRGGDYFHTSVAWMISDSLASVGEFTYDFDQDKLTQWRAGLSLVHTPVLTTFVDYEEIDTLDTRLFTYGFTYKITSKYSMAFTHRMDFSNSGDDQRSVDVSLVRELARWKLIGVYSYDEIDGDQTFGIMLLPMGLGGSRYNRPIFDSALR